MSSSTHADATQADSAQSDLDLSSAPRRTRGLWRDTARYLLHDPLVVACVLYIATLVVVSVFPDTIAPLSYEQTSFRDKLLSPGSIATSEKLAGHRFLLGSDRLGRDILSRLVYGTRVSIAVAFIGSAVSFLIGVGYGLVSGYSSARIDNLMMRLVDVVYGYPTLILVILLQVYLTGISQQEAGQTTGLQRVVIGLDNRTGGLFFVFVAVGAVSWLNMARLTRGQVMHFRDQEFVQAAYAVGVPDRLILWRHLLPNVLGPCIVAGTLAIPTYIYTEAFLSFIGLGVQPPMPSWGGMISKGYGAMRSAPHLIFPPALALFLTMLAFNFLGDAVRDAMDPRIRHR
ncbi:MAG: Oligopeptide transport system permease protein OppC [Anaerolineales bacterium]|nr:Oligopeptide transport system permease protein OppC [Anaerolineales bacterium]